MAGHGYMQFVRPHAACGWPPGRREGAPGRAAGALFQNLNILVAVQQFRAVFANCCKGRKNMVHGLDTCSHDIFIYLNCYAAILIYPG